MSAVETSPPSSRDGEAVLTPPPTSPPEVDGAPPETDQRARRHFGVPTVVVRARPAFPRRWERSLRVLAVALLVLLPAGVAAMVSASQPPTYGAVAEVLYSGGPAASQEDVDRQLATQRVLLVSRPAIASAARAVGRDVKTITENVETEVLEGSSVIRLRAEDRSATVARAIATSLVAQYTATVQGETENRLEVRRQAVTTRIDAANARLQEVNARILAIAGGPAIPAGVGNVQLPLRAQAEVRTLETEAQVLRQQIADLESQAILLNAADPEAAVATAEIVASASLLPEPVGPQPLRAAAAGGLLGLLLAFVLVTVARHRRPADEPEAAVARP